MTSPVGDLPLPPFHDDAHAGRWAYVPDQARLMEEAARWIRRFDLRPAAEDRFRLELLLIDVQKDFCLPEGTLYVGGRSGTGAVEDSRRIAAFVHRNLARITSITTTMDTHHAFQIFFASFWVDREGANLSPHREITAESVARGDVRPDGRIAPHVGEGDARWLERQALHYCRQLEEAGKYRLYLWPPHCILGSAGHALVGLVHEARMFHSFARHVPSPVVEKGEHPLTENYSVLRPEVLTRHDGGSLAEPDRRLLERLVGADALVVAGQASSHCVLWTLDDLLEHSRRVDPALARKVYVLSDAMSAVAVPDGKGGFIADFTSQAQAALARWGEAGMHIVRSTDPIDSWPGLERAWRG